MRAWLVIMRDHDNLTRAKLYRAPGEPVMLISRGVKDSNAAKREILRSGWLVEWHGYDAVLKAGFKDPEISWIAEVEVNG